MTAQGDRDQVMRGSSMTNTMIPSRRCGRQRRRRYGLATIVAALTCLICAPTASAAFGDLFGIAPVNDGAGPLQDSPVFDGSRAFWAGTCDRSAAPASLPADLVSLGGIGSLPPTVPATTGLDPPSAQLADVTAPPTPDSCVDWGVLPTLPSQVDHWSVPPAWRLPPATAAGSHADGSLTMWLREGGERRQR
jgi:hypothetical protein